MDMYFCPLLLEGGTKVVERGAWGRPQPVPSAESIDLAGRGGVVRGERVSWCLGYAGKHGLARFACGALAGLTTRAVGARASICGDDRGDARTWIWTQQRCGGGGSRRALARSLRSTFRRRRAVSAAGAALACAAGARARAVRLLRPARGSRSPRSRRSRRSSCSNGCSLVWRRSRRPRPRRSPRAGYKSVFLQVAAWYARTTEINPPPELRSAEPGLRDAS